MWCWAMFPIFLSKKDHFNENGSTRPFDPKVKIMLPHIGLVHYLNSRSRSLVYYPLYNGTSIYFYTACFSLQDHVLLFKNQTKPVSMSGIVHHFSMFQGVKYFNVYNFQWKFGKVQSCVISLRFSGEHGLFNGHVTLNIVVLSSLPFLSYSNITVIANVFMLYLVFLFFVALSAFVRLSLAFNIIYLRNW